MLHTRFIDLNFQLKHYEVTNDHPSRRKPPYKKKTRPLQETPHRLGPPLPIVPHVTSAGRISSTLVTAQLRKYGAHAGYDTWASSLLPNLRALCPHYGAAASPLTLYSLEVCLCQEVCARRSGFRTWNNYWVIPCQNKEKKGQRLKIAFLWRNMKEYRVFICFLPFLASVWFLGPFWNFYSKFLKRTIFKKWILKNYIYYLILCHWT